SVLNIGFGLNFLSHTSICLTIQPVVHGKHHRIERTKRCATGAGRTASLPCLALSLSPAQPPGPTSRIGAERVCIYYFLFSFTLASVFLSTKWSIDSLTVSSDLRCAAVFGRATSMPGLALSLSPAQPPGPLKQDRGRVGVYLLFSF